MSRLFDGGAAVRLPLLALALALGACRERAVTPLTGPDTTTSGQRHVVVSPKAANVLVGGTVQLAATVYDQNGATMAATISADDAVAALAT